MSQELLEKSREELAKPTTIKFFQRQAANEKLNPGKGSPDFSMVFNRTLADFLHVVGRETAGLPKADLKSVPIKERPQRIATVRSNLRQRTTSFMEDMRNIEMEDTIYPDVKTAFSVLVQNVDGVLVWTNSNTNYQLAKIEKSKIQNLLKNADQSRGVLMAPLISGDKIKDVVPLLRTFSEKHPQEEMTVVIYDDSQGNFEKVDKTIQKFEEETGRNIRRLFVWAKIGRVSESITEEKTQEAISGLPQSVSDNLRVAISFTEFVNIVREYRTDSDGPLLALLDFDGALSDNRIMRMRQSQVFHDHLRGIIRDIILPNGTKEELEGMEQKLEDALKGQK